MLVDRRHHDAPVRRGAGAIAICISIQARGTPSIHEPYFFGYVEDLLQQEYGTNTVREGGLKVYTTIRPGLQRAATAAVTHILTVRPILRPRSFPSTRATERCAR